MGRKSLVKLLAEQPRKLLRKDPGETLRAAVEPDALIVRWWTELPNWGDAVTPVLVEWLSGRRPIAHERIVNVRGRPVYAVVGSVLDDASIFNLEIWGAGFKSENAGFKLRPRRVHAVRGPLTRQAIMAQGIECPEVFGDPALLFPRLYTPEVEPRWRLGFVPHYVDRDSPAVARMRARDDVNVIDILGGVRSVPDEICSCEAVASSSLHGLILADAYGIPSVRMQLSDRIHGGDFKFRDYFASCGSMDRDTVQMTEDTPATELMDRARRHEPRVDLESLLEACPFFTDATTHRKPAESRT